MTWQKIYSITRTVIILGGALVGAGGFYAFVIAGLCRILFDLEESVALIWIGGPIFFAFTIWGGIYLPSHFRKIGLIE